jgi:hypothetical protein
VIVREAEARDVVVECEKEAEKLLKADSKKLNASAALYKKKQQEAAKEAREKAKEAREKEKEAKAKKLKEARERKQQEKDTATSQKSRDTLNKGKRKASRSQNLDAAKRCSVVGSISGEVAAALPAT